jgi:hypothetical protein
MHRKLQVALFEKWPKPMAANTLPKQIGWDYTSPKETNK